MATIVQPRIIPGIIIIVLLVILILIPELPAQSLEIVIILPLTTVIQPQVIRQIAIVLRLIQLTVHQLTVLHHTATVHQPIIAHLVYQLIPHQVIIAVAQFTRHQLAFPLTAIAGTKSEKRSNKNAAIESGIFN